MSDHLCDVPRRFVGDVFAWFDEVAARLVTAGTVPKAHALTLLTALREDMRKVDPFYADQLIPEQTESVGAEPTTVEEVFGAEGNPS